MASHHPRSRVRAIPVQPVSLVGGNRADTQAGGDSSLDAEDDLSQAAHGSYVQDRVSFPHGFAVDLSGRFDAWRRTRPARTDAPLGLRNHRARSRMPRHDRGQDTG